MQMSPEPESNNKIQQRALPLFHKRWGWFYFLIIFFFTWLPFFLHQFYMDFFLNVNADRMTLYQASLFLLGMLVISLALSIHIYEVYSVEITSSTISKKSMGKKIVMCWNEIERVDYDAGITLVAGKNQLNINPAIFKNHIAVYEFVELQWNQDATNVVHH